jgi:hypothetical protein
MKKIKLLNCSGLIMTDTESIIMSEDSRIKITIMLLKKAEIRRKILPIETDFTMD